MNIKKDIIPLLQETWKEFQQDDAAQLGAALSYYAMFSIFPLLLLLLAFLGFVLNYWPVAITAQEQILNVVTQTFSSKMGDSIQELLDVLKDRAGAATGVGLVTLLFGASGVFQQLDASFNKIWRVPPRPQAAGIVSVVWNVVRSKLFSFGMVLAVGFLMLISLVLTGVSQVLLSVLSHVPVVGGASGYVLGLVIAVLLSTLIFALLFRYLPNTDVRWGDVMIGALLTAVVWEVAKRLLALYIDYSSRSFSAYGAIGTMLVLMIWVYFSSQVLFLGAEFTEVFSRRHGSRAPAPAPEGASQPAASEKPAVQPEAISAGPAGHSTGTVAVAGGAGLLVGVLGSLVALAAMLFMGVRRAVALVKGRGT